MAVPMGETRIIGRAKPSDIAIDDDHFMSSRHFEIQNCGGFAEVRDLNSTNKTWVNNVAIANVKISSGDTLRAGKTTFGLEWESLVPIVETPQPQPMPDKVQTQVSSQNDPRDSPISSSFAFFMPKSPMNVDDPLRIPDVEFKPSGNSPIPAGEFTPGGNSPIESMDATFEEPIFEDSIGANDSNPFTANKSFISSLDEDSQVFGASSARVEESRTWNRLVSGTKVHYSNDFYKLIKHFSDNHCTKVVVHFKKIGMRAPESILAKPVFEDIPNSSQLLPIMIDGSEWLCSDKNAFTPRLAAADGIMLFIAPKHGSLERLKSLSEQAIPGMSEAGGFLGWCWPSHWHEISQNQSDTEILALLGEAVKGIVYPWKTKIWAQCESQLKTEFQGLGFGDYLAS